MKAADLPGVEPGDRYALRSCGHSAGQGVDGIGGGRHMDASFVLSCRAGAAGAGKQQRQTQGGGAKGVDQSLFPQWDDPLYVVYWISLYTKYLGNAIIRLDGSSARPTLLRGGSGCGKMRSKNTQKGGVSLRKLRRSRSVAVEMAGERK